MKVILYDDNGLKILKPNYQSRSFNGKTEQEILDACIKRHNLTDFKIMDESQIEQDRSYRNAWCYCQKAGMRIDFEKARELCKKRLRRERAPLLAELDIKAMRKIENEEPLDDIKNEKQRLRDITKLADQAKTLEELSAIKVN